MAAPCRTFLRLSSEFQKSYRVNCQFARGLSASAKSFSNDVTSSQITPPDTIAKLHTPETLDMEIRQFPSDVEYEEEPDVLYSKMVVEVKGHDDAVLNSYQYFVVFAAKCLGVSEMKVTKPQMDIVRRALLKSVHIFKKHQVHYEQRTYYRQFTVSKLTGATADTFLEYIQRNLPEGVAMKVTKHKCEVLPAHLKPPSKQQVPDKKSGSSLS